MSERVLTGLAASPGLAVGAVAIWGEAGDAGTAPLSERPRPVPARPARGRPASTWLPEGEATPGERGAPVGPFATAGLNPQPSALGRSEVAAALAALGRVAAELGDEAARLRASGRADEADILEASQLMAEDPGLLDDVRAGAPHAGARGAILAATERHALVLAALPDPNLAARAADVRAVGRRAVRALAASRRDPRTPAPATGEAEARPPPTGGPFLATAGTHPDPAAAPAEGAGGWLRTGRVLIARDLGPAEVAELRLGAGGVAGAPADEAARSQAAAVAGAPADGAAVPQAAIVAIALVDGATTSHAAIVARSYGVPMIVGLGASLLAVRPGAPIVVDGDAGEVVVDPGPARRRAAEAAMRRAARRRPRTARSRRPLRTRDGRIVRLLCNAARADEVVAGLAAGAEGLGLLRTELAFLAARDWPSEAEHLAALGPVLAPLSGLVATVRTLDFGADKTPPFLRGTRERGIALTLRHPDALLAQLRAIARAGAATRLRVKLPLVEDAAQVAAGRRLLADAVAAVGRSRATPTLLGASIETPGAVERIDEIAAESDFLSIGTNDLAAYALGQDRAQPLAAARAAADPRVLALIRRVVAAAHARGLSVVVCGEAAGDPELAAGLVEAGVDELSMAPPRLEAVWKALRRVTVG